MPRNIEIKARIERMDTMADKVAAIADQGPIELWQDDTFFACATGRLKLRISSSEQGELIYYRRPDQAGPKESFYLRAATTDPEILRRALTLACGGAGRVRKRRLLFFVGRSRVHLDQVEELGDFLELEVVLADDEPSEVGTREAHQLMQRLGITPPQLVEGAYVDLLTRDHDR